jgi:hypothetical protein
MLRRAFAARGRRDGRRALPLVSIAGGQPSPALYRLRDEMIREAATLRAEEVEQTIAARVSLARLVGPAGERAREESRLQHLQARLDHIKADGPRTDLRLGEEALPLGLVQLRREREHERRLHVARKRVEDQRTAISALATKEHALRASLAEARRSTEAQLRLVGAERKTQAASYFNGALRTHPERPLLSALVPELAPRLPRRTGSNMEENK